MGPFLLSSLLFALCGCAEEAGVGKAEASAPPVYVNEAKLPEGWPLPGPYNEVTKKTYPAYRVAETDNGGQGRSFWTLFGHIKSKGIPMTAPVEMGMTAEEGSLKMETMGFLYQNLAVGETGAAGKKVMVKDRPEMTVLSYAWIGPRTDETLAEIKRQLEAAARERQVTITDFRLLGYNGPSVPKAKRTHELQAFFKK